MLNFSRLIVNYSETIDKLIKDWELREYPIFNCFLCSEFDSIKNNNSLNDYDYLYLSTEINHPEFSFTRYWVKCIIHSQQNKQADNYDKAHLYYNELLKTSLLPEKVKAAIELENLNLILEKDCFKFNNSKEKHLFPSFLNDISNMISNGYVFKNNISSFRFLLALFSNNLITENLSPNKLSVCLNSFNDLHVMAKKVIFKNLIKKKQEVIILNLMDKGINLNWMIDFDGNGKEEVCSLKILENLKLSDVLLSNNDWNILAQNSVGDNILHIFCGSSLMDESNLKKLQAKISSLSFLNKQSLLTHTNHKNLSPLNQAILFQDEAMIDFLLNQEDFCFEENNNSIDFIEGCLDGKNINLFPDSLKSLDPSTKLWTININTDLWTKLLKNFNSEKLSKDLSTKLVKKALIEKLIKI